MPDICSRDPAMMTKRGQLLELAKQQVYDSGFQFKMGKSRYVCVHIATVLNNDS